MKKLLEELTHNLINLSEEQLLTIHDAVCNLLKESKSTIEVEACPYCGGKTVKNGKQCGKQRHQCKSCKATFTCTVNTVMYRSRASIAAWQEVISDTINFVPIDATADRLGFSHDRVFHMRHKVLAALEKIEIEEPKKLSAVSELDETFVLESMKGTKIPDDYWREARKHGATAQKRGVSNEYICICTGIGRESGEMAISVNRAKPDASEIKLAFEGRLDDNALVICDGLKTYNILGSEFGCSVKDINNETDRFFHLNNANGFHSFIKRQYEFYRGVATKYLNRYNALLAKMYRATKSCIEGIYHMLCRNNRHNSYYSKNALKTLRLLHL
jgi:transposase-like protein